MGKEGNGSRNSPQAPLPRRPVFAGPMSPSNGCNSQPASARNLPGLRQAQEEKEMAGSTSAPNFRRMRVFPSLRKISRWRWTEARKLQRSLVHASYCTRPDAAAQNRLQRSTAGSTLQCVRSRAQPGALGTVQCGFAFRSLAFPSSWPPALGACS